jgi:hypothetical protein
MSNVHWLFDLAFSLQYSYARFELSLGVEYPDYVVLRFEALQFSRRIKPAFFSLPDRGVKPLICYRWRQQLDVQNILSYYRTSHPETSFMLCYIHFQMEHQLTNVYNQQS